MLVDSHCHLDRLKLDEGDTIAKAVARAHERGIEHMLCVSVSLDEYETMSRDVAEFDNVSVSCGVHPLDLEGPLDEGRLLKLAQEPSVVAIGETGLDYYYSKDSKPIQQQSFARHIQIGNELDKPIIIHTRDSRQDTLDIMAAEQARECGGVMHCFTETKDMARAAMDMGFYISFSGIVTFRNASELREVAQYVPLDMMLIETDSPYLAPVPHRGKSNQPMFVREVAEFMAELKGVTLEQIAQTTTDNFYKLFKGVNRVA